MAAGGFIDAEVRTVLSPPWTTDWMAPEARNKLAAVGIAPPASLATAETTVTCPQCDARSASIVSEFGSTACKALMVCDSCGEPFDLFKAL